MTTSVYLATACRNAARDICQWDERDDSAAQIQSSEKDLERQVDQWPWEELGVMHSAGHMIEVW